MINNEFPSPSEFIENEIKTLEYLKNDKTIYENYLDLYNDARNSYFKYKDFRKINSFNFESNLELIFQNDVRSIHVGSLIQLNNKTSFDNITYYFALCGHENNPNHILRKFHFDYTIPSNYRRTPHPIFHLQFCGTLSQNLENKGFIDRHFHPELSEPRIFFTPMTLALLLNMIFKEFNDEYIDNFRNTLEWRNIVKQNEDLIMMPFYGLCNKFFVDRINRINHTNELFITDYCYAD